jgi:predicted RNase H-like HicB family nuclease
MNREYLVVYEKGPKNYSGFSPDVPGCGSMGDTVEDTRANLREALEFHLFELAKAGDPIPETCTTTVNFEEFDPEHEETFVVEWITISLPEQGFMRPPHGLRGVA